MSTLPRVLPALVPIIIRLFPALKEVRLIRGVIVPISDAEAAGEEELARNLARKLDLKKRERFNDNSAVVKVIDVKKCYEENAQNGGLILTFLKALCKTAIDTSAPNGAQAFGDEFMKCVRDKALPQTARRKRITYRYAKREI